MKSYLYNRQCSAPILCAERERVKEKNLDKGIGSLVTNERLGQMPNKRLNLKKVLLCDEVLRRSR